MCVCVSLSLCVCVCVSESVCVRESVKTHLSAVFSFIYFRLSNSFIPNQNSHQISDHITFQSSYIEDVLYIN